MLVKTKCATDSTSTDPEPLCGKLLVTRLRFPLSGLRRKREIGRRNGGHE
jgi:hypothetical protein